MEYFTSLILYAFIFGISITFCLIYQHIYKKSNYKEPSVIKKAIWFVIIIIPPVFISTIRFGVGTDYFNYIEIYERVNSWPSHAVWSFYGNEPLFLLLNKLSFYLFSSEIGVFLFSSIIIHIFIVMGIDYFKKNISMSLALFLYYVILFNFGLNGIRTTIAIAIVFFAIRYIHKSKFIPYLFWILIATMFHNTAIICLIFFLLVQKKRKLVTSMRNFYYYCVIILTPIILVFAINAFVNFPIFSNYAHYFTNDRLTFRVGFLLDILPVLVPLFLYKKHIIAKDRSYEPLINLALLNIPFQYIGYYIDWGSRLALYTNTLYFILVPMVISSIKRSDDKILIGMYYIGYFIIVYMIKYVIGNSSEGFPYETILW